MRKGTAVAFLIVLAMALASCGTKNDTTSTPSAPGTKSTEGTTINVIVATGKRDSFLYLPSIIAEQLGFFKEEGLAVEFRDTYKGGQPIAQAVAGGEVDFGLTVPDNVIKFKTQGIDLVMLAGQTRLPGVAIVVDSKYQDSIKSLKDLRGKKVGVTSAGSGSHQALVAILEREGLKGEDVQVFGVGFELSKAFADGTVVAGANYDPVITDLTMAKKGYVLGPDLRKGSDVTALYGSDYPYSGLIALRDAVKKDPNRAERMVRAIVKADQWMASHSSSEIAAKVPAEIKGNEATYIAALTNSKETFSADGMIEVKGMETVIKALVANKVLPANVTVDPSSVLDMTFVLKAR